MKGDQERFRAHSRAYREPAQIISHWNDAAAVDPVLLRTRTTGGFQELLAKLGVNLIVSREYENFLLFLGGGESSYLPMPHPSGIAYNAARGVVSVASTRNPNEIYEFKPIGEPFKRKDRPTSGTPHTLVPAQSAFYPGSLYLHDLAYIQGQLFGNAVAHNAVVKLDGGRWERVWWPNCIPAHGGFETNFLQLNSIAAGSTLEDSFFTASCAAPGHRRPGQRNFAVKGRGVVFSGKTREVVASGLTRPHSARFWGSRLLVANSGYGTLCEVAGSSVAEISRHQGWTRGLTVAGDYAFVGVSRILPGFELYAPGVKSATARCGIDAVDLKSGQVVASVRWAAGNQIFAIEAVPAGFASGLPFTGKAKDAKPVFYAFSFKSQS